MDKIQKLFIFLIEVKKKIFVDNLSTTIFNIYIHIPQHTKSHKTYNKQETKSTLITRIQTYYIIHTNTNSNMDKKSEAKIATKKVELSTNACTTINPLVKLDKKLLETKKNKQ